MWDTSTTLGAWGVPVWGSDAAPLPGPPDVPAEPVCGGLTLPSAPFAAQGSPGGTHAKRTS